MQCRQRNRGGSSWLACLALFALGASVLLAQTGPATKDAGDKKTSADPKKATDKTLPDIKFHRWSTSECLLEANYKDKDEQGRPIPPYLDLKATFAFETIKENTLVYLGLKGAYLTAPGKFLGEVPHIQPDDDGNYFLLVPKANKYPKLVLNLELPVKTKEGTGVGPERSFDLGLPGAPSTRVVLKLPTSIKKLRWNEHDEEQTGGSGVWELKWFGTEKNLKAQWKEPGPAPVGLAMSKTDTQIDVLLEKTHTEMTGRFNLELQRGQTKEWQVWLPPQAKVTTPPDWEWVLPEGKPVPFLLRSKKGATAERVSFVAQFVTPRTAAQPKVIVGPFLVVGTGQSEGTITVRATPDLLQGNRLFYNRLGELYFREPPKGLGSDVVAQFQFQANPFANKPMPGNKALLEIDIKQERVVHETLTFHEIKLRAEAGQTFVETESRFVTKAPAAAPVALDMEVFVPTIYPWETQAAAFVPLAGYPAALPLTLWRYPSDTIFPAHVASPDDGPLPPMDAARRIKLRTVKNLSGEWEARLQLRYPVPPGQQRLQLDMPRPSGTWDRGGKATLIVPPQFELLVRSRGFEEPVGSKLVLPYDQAPASVELAWRNFIPEIPANVRAVVTITGQDVLVRESISVPRPKGPVSILDNKMLALSVPQDIAPKLVSKDGPRDRETAGPPGIWRVKPQVDTGDHVELEIEYYVPIKDQGRSISFALPLLWPDKITWKQATVYFVTEPGIFPRVVGEKVFGRLWHVAGANARDASLGDRVPALVLTAAGNDLPLTIELDKPDGFRPSALDCDRTQVDVIVNDEGAQAYTAEFQVQKISGGSLDVEFPVPSTQVEMYKVPRDEPGKKVPLIWENVNGNANVARLKLSDDIGKIKLLKFQYKIPSTQTAGKRFWQTTFYPPRFSSDVFLGKVHWNIALQETQVPIVLGNVQVDYRWGLPRWLLGPESPDHNFSIMLVRDRLETQRLYHPGWQPWILMCSGAVLMLGIVFLMLRERRFWSWVLATSVVAGLAAIAWFSPYFLLPFFWGAQAGMAVLALVAAVQWFLQERYRRQLIFLPGFSRGQPGSTLTRGKKPREPSTIDAPLSHGTGSGS